MEWFRWYHGAISDPKWPLIAKKSGQNIGTVVSIWAAILEHASQNSERGSVVGFDPDTIDALYGYEDGTTVTVCNAMKRHGVLHETEHVISWEKRQPKREREDSSGDRVRRFREKQKLNNTEYIGDSEASVTPCNASVTPVQRQETPRTEQRREEQKREKKEENIPHGDAVTVRSQPDSQPEFYLTKKKRKLTGKRLDTFNRFWTAFAYPKGKADAADAWMDIPTLNSTLVDEIVTAAEAEAANRSAVIASGGSPKWAQGWITGRRWEDKVVPLHGAMTLEEKSALDAIEMRKILEAKGFRAQ